MDRPVARFADAARALLAIETLSEKEGQFCGGLAFRATPLSDKQANWLHILLERHSLPSVAQGGEHD